MAIVIEGMDASGKSSLALYIANIIKPNRIITSEGPPKAPGEMNQRIMRYEHSCYSNDHHKVLFDRHPAVSNPIYDVMRLLEDKPIDPIDPELIKQFYGKGHTFIYCDPTTDSRLQSHVVKAGEDPEHLEAIAKRYDRLLESYRAWAMKHAHVIYRIGDDPLRVLKMVL